MCGISGFINLNGEKINHSILKSMNDAISHRGPDGEGFWIENEVGLAHRRLAILDLSKNGSQPMMSFNNRFVISYNGEIYNFRDLEKELNREGIFSKSKCDTEVLVNALSIWGVDALTKLNGMFAFALWDRDKNILTLARDRYGIKPIYYSMQGNNFFFASEQKAIIEHPKFIKKFNEEALKEYFTFQNIFTNKTFFKDINILESGSFLKLETNKNNQISIHKYWDYNFTNPAQTKDEKGYIEELQRLFKQAIDRQLISDVDIGSYLSGGIDSGSITAIASSKFPRLKTFTCGFDLSSAIGLELDFDERSKAEAVSSKYNTEHYEMILNSHDMEECISKVVHHLEEPRVGQSYPNFCVAKLASKFVKVVLAGDGGDELFAGYPWRYYKTANCKSFKTYIDEYYKYWQRLLNDQEIKSLFSPIWSKVDEVNTKDIFRNVFPNYFEDPKCPEDFINNSLYLEAKTFLHGIFVVEDKLSMAHGLETRVPFMDNDLVEFAMRCPISLKLNNLSRNIKLNENISGNKKNIFQRLKKRKSLNRYDQFDMNFYNKVQKGFLKLAKSNKKSYKIIDSNLDIKKK